MIRLAALLPLALCAAAANAQPTPASARISPQAAELFERDWVLMHWALKSYDRDRDLLLSSAEAQAAANAFREIADADTDGRITPTEFRAARAFILARY
jgi:hypothetical protein